MNTFCRSIVYNCFSIWTANVKILDRSFFYSPSALKRKELNNEELHFLSVMIIFFIEIELTDLLLTSVTDHHTGKLNLKPME